MSQALIAMMSQITTCLASHHIQQKYKEITGCVPRLNPQFQLNMLRKWDELSKQTLGQNNSHFIVVF